MAKARKNLHSSDATDELTESLSKARLKKLIIKNYRCIGSEGVTIDIDDIVVLVGPNNVGKSTILRAYELAMTPTPLKLEDFPNATVGEASFPTIEMHYVIPENYQPHERWIAEDPITKEKYVQERFIWKRPGADFERNGYEVAQGDWVDQVPYGAINVSNAAKAKPYRVDAFDSPENQADVICKLLLTILKDRAKSHGKNPEDPNSQSQYDTLLEQIATFQKEIVGGAKEEIEAVEEELSRQIAKVFSNYEVEFDAKAEDDLDKIFSPFKANATLRIGPSNGHKSPIEYQGSGARRTLLWTAIKLVAEQEKKGKGSKSLQPRLLLIDEPEICLHPNAIREACKLLYDLPQSGNWQVIVTTHCPIFIDLAKDNTTIVRVEKATNNVVSGTTIYRPRQASLNENDRQNLKLLNIFDPYVAEFFFGGRTLLVEGDTEYSVFRYIAEVSNKREEFANLHIIRARGKSTIISLAKILNQFDTPYFVLHDSDHPTAKSKDKIIVNPAWSNNSLIREEIQKSKRVNEIRHLVSIPTFEKAYFGELPTKDKPYFSLEKVQQDPTAFKTCEDLLLSLLSGALPPTNCVIWESIESLEAVYTNWQNADLVSAGGPLAV